MKRPLLAFSLSFFLPGAGLVYLGKWKLGLLNLLIVLSVGVLMAVVLPSDVFEKFIRPIAAGLGGGSGALAQHFAKQMNLGVIPKKMEK